MAHPVYAVRPNMAVAEMITTAATVHRARQSKVSIAPQPRFDLSIGEDLHPIPQREMNAGATRQKTRELPLATPWSVRSRKFCLPPVLIGPGLYASLHCATEHGSTVIIAAGGQAWFLITIIERADT